MGSANGEGSEINDVRLLWAIPLVLGGIDCKPFIVLEVTSLAVGFAELGVPLAGSIKGEDTQEVRLLWSSPLVGV